MPLEVAWVTPYLPSPENTGGRIRIAQLARGFGVGARVHLFARISEHDAAEVGRTGGRAPEGSPWASVTALPSGVIRAGLSWEPPPAQAMPEGMARALSARHRERPFDAAVVEHSYAAAGLPRLPGAAVVVDEHNIESTYPPAAPGRVGRGLRERVDHALWERFERRVWRGADAVTVVSEQDAAAVRRVRAGGVEVIPNGVTTEAYRFLPPSARAGYAVLFVGLMFYEPNVRAAEHLVREVLPRLLRRVPEATITLAGRDPSAEVRALAGERVRVTGTVASVAALFDEHAAYAMPITLGAGSSLKVLEPLACGLPLVAPSFAVRGFALAPGEHYLPAESADETAAALARALTDRAALDPMADRARQVAARHAWPGIAARFAEVVKRAVARRGARG